MLSPESEIANFDSWARTAFLIEEQPDDDLWLPYKVFLRRIFQLGARDGLCYYFRAGQSMHHIIFSTCERHRLESYDPPPLRITLLRREAEWFVAASYANLYFHEPIKKTAVTSEDVWPILKSYLNDLWRETRPEERLPKPLN